MTKTTKHSSFLKNLINPFRFGANREGREAEDLERIAAQEQKHFSYGVLADATNDFHPNHKLGEGGFGSVYKGKLDDGRVIAVKKLSQKSSQGTKEFMIEAKLLAHVQHRNVVNLLGFCVHDVEKLLVYEYVANESLDKLLFQSRRREELYWERRYGIISGIARGLLHLHENSHIPIIHRDIKASNILLDDRWVPKIADFGMARLFSEDHTHVKTSVVGTNGYMAPEYLMHGHLSVKADVFSFGVLTIELISGHKNSTFSLDLDARNLIDWAWKLYKKERTMEIIDPKLALSDSSIMDQIKLCIHIGLLCVQGDPHLRPTMSRVIVMLSRKVGSLDEPTRPGYPGSTRHRKSHRSGASSSTGYVTSDSSANTHDCTITTSSGHNTITIHDPNGKKPIEE